MNRVRAVAIAVGVVVAALGVVLALNIDRDADASTGGIVGRRVEFALDTIDGDRVTSADLAGRTVVVNFWNTWCIPCIREAPALKRFWDEHRDVPDLVMIGIVRDEPGGERAVRAYVEGEGVNWIVALDPRSRASLAFGVTGQPETFVIGPDGVVRRDWNGEVTYDQLVAWVREARSVG